MREVSERFDFDLSSKVSARVYADCRPGGLQTSRLQKGVVLVSDGRELVEEGIGIGVPICLYEDGGHFSLSAATYVVDSKTRRTAVKVYCMNAIESKRFRGGTIRRGSCAKHFLRILEKVYREIRWLHLGAGKMLDVVTMMGLTNEYEKSCSKGQIPVSYEPTDGGLQINVDLNSVMTEGLQAVIIGNEQGGRLFTDYNDSSGQKREGRQIEPWRSTSADWATLTCPQLGIGFMVCRPNGWRIVRGREVVEGRISWSGLNLVCDGVPKSKTLTYRVDVLGGVASD
jgi:hypothetical protein